MDSLPTEDLKAKYYAYLNKQDTKGRTALAMAVENNRVESTATLLSFKADPNIADNEGKTALDIAILNSNTGCITNLLDDKVSLKLDFVSHLPEAERETFVPKLISNVFEMKSGHEQKAEVLERLLKKGAIIYPSALESLLVKAGSNRPVYATAIDNALEYRARQLSLKLKDLPNPPLPISVDTVEAKEHCPMDDITKLTGFTIPLDA